METNKVDKVLFDDALTLTGFGKFNYMLLALVTSLIMGMAFEIYSVSYLVPASACELGTVSSQQGVTAGIPLLGIIMTSHIWGYLGDTKGRKKTLCWGMTLGFCAGSLAAFSPNWIVLTILKFISSCGVAGTYALALTLLGECTPEAKRSTLISLTSTMFLLSTGSMALIAIPILPLKFSYYIPFLGIHFNSWRLLTIIYSSVCAISALGTSFAYESPKYLLSMGQEEEALKVLKGIYRINHGSESDGFKVKSITLDEESARKTNEGLWASVMSQTIPLFKPPLLKNTILLALIFFLVYFCLNPYMVWLPYISDGIMRSVERGHNNVTLCQMLYSSHDVNMTQKVPDETCSLNEFAMSMVFFINIFLAIVNCILSAVMNFVGRKAVLIAIPLISGTAGMLVNVSNMWMISVVLFITFVAGVLNFGFLATYSVDIFPTYVRAMAVCFTLMVGRGSSVLGINLLKELLINNCETSFYFFGALATAGGLVGIFLPSDVKKKKVDGA